MLRITAAIAIISFVLACKKSSSSPPGSNSHSDTTAVSIGFVINPLQEGRAIPADFTGLSFETGSLPDTTFFNPSNATFIRLIRGLGQGVIRVGGNTSDKMFVTDGAIDRFFSFAGATGWKVMFGLNLGTGTPGAAALEAAYIYNHYSDRLLYFEIGNEPDLYGTNGLRPPGYSYTDFRKEFDIYYDSIKRLTPDAVFSGPTTATHTDTWLVPFARDEHSRIGLLTQHYYKMGPAGNPSVTIGRLLNGNTGINSQAATMAAAAGEEHLPFRISECNSVYGGGENGISNTLASALWTLDYMFNLAEEGAAGVNFHGGGTGPYTPIAFSQRQFTARPMYYGMLFFHMASAGRLLKVTPEGGMPDMINITAHAAAQQDGSLLVTLINKDTVHSAVVTLAAGDHRWINAALLRLTGPSPSANTDITLGGSSVQTDGTWTSLQQENGTITAGNTCLVKVPAGSAALVTLK
ncbi:MAG: hypothetical protein J0H74_02895 [Chitinophagaceae bacterium]|nr:hypothetical protein [Chitinophagaceae bacterium]